MTEEQQFKTKALSQGMEALKGFLSPSRFSATFKRRRDVEGQEREELV